MKLKDYIPQTRMLFDDILIKNTINNFVDLYWYAPQDCLLRGVESMIWAKRYFEPPVLDIGIGHGRNSRLLFAYNQKIDVGIDINADGVEEAKNYEIYQTVKVDDATKMKFKDESFNTVISHSTFEHIENDISAVSEVARILNPNGLFYFTIPLPRLVKNLKKIGISKEMIAKYNNRVSHYHYREIDEWKDILKKKKLLLKYSGTYFPINVLDTHFKLHRIATIKPYKRELWSYLKDSSYGQFFPKSIVKPLIKYLMIQNINKAFNGDGSLAFLIAQKK